MAGRDTAAFARLACARPVGDGFDAWCDLTQSPDTPKARQHHALASAFAAVARELLIEQATQHGVADDVLRTSAPHVFALDLFDDRATPEITALARQLTREHGADAAAALGWLHQHAVPSADRHRLGQFYTRESVVRFMNDLAFPRTAIGGRVLDPACGAGAYLLDVTRRIVEQHSVPAEALTAVRAAIHGWDINPLSVLLCEASLTSRLLGLIAAAPGAHGPLSLTVRDSLHATPVRDGEYDVIVANPPYSKVSLRDLDMRLRDRYAPVIHGQPNLYGLFMALSADLLAADGRLVLITPRSWVNGSYFAALRRYLRNRLDFRTFARVEDRSSVFEGVLQEVFITEARRRPQSRHLRVATYRQSLSDRPTRAYTGRSAEHLLEGPDAAVFVPTDRRTAVTYGVARRTGRRLESIAEVRTGPVVWNRHKDDLSDGPGPLSRPLIFSRAVTSDGFAGHGHRDGTSNFLRITDRTRPLLTYGRAVLVKRLTSNEDARRIVACLVSDELASAPDGYFVENHVNVITVKPGADISPHLLCWLLNASWYDELLRAISGNTQIGASELRALPLPPPAVLQTAETAGHADGLLDDWLQAPSIT